MRTARTATIVLGLLLLHGCGSEAKREQQPDEQLVSLVTGTPDKALNAKQAKEHFVTVPAKGELQRYAQLSFEPAGSPSVSGNTATVPVKITAPDGTLKGEVTWEFVKDGDRWKLKNAPLP